MIMADGGTPWGKRAGGLVPRAAMVGRARELTVLEQTLGKVTSFLTPHWVTISGVEGVGKSRLLEEFIARRAVGTNSIRGHAIEGKPLSVIASLLRDRFPVRMEGGPPATVAERAELFRAMVRAVMAPNELEDALHFLGTFVGLDFPASGFAQLLAENPRQGEIIARTVLRRFLERDAARAPLIVALDDMHLCDAESAAFLRELAANVGGCAVLFVAIVRPEQALDWQGTGIEHVDLPLASLGPDDARTLFKSLLVNVSHVPDELCDAALEMTAGNPLFLEQLVRLFVANGSVTVVDGHWRLDETKALDTELPFSIGQAISARVASLTPDERRLLERAAVFGNVFWRSAVVSLARLEEQGAPDVWTEDDPAATTASQMLTALAERDYVLALAPEDSSMSSDMEFVFKHNLEREQVLRTTSVERRKTYSLAAAAWLESRPNRSDEHWEFLASLYEQGDNRTLAARRYLEGANRARASYQGDTARSLYQKALALMEPDDPARIDALHNLGDVLEHGGKPLLAEARFREMLGIAWRYDAANKGGAANLRLAKIARRSGASQEAEKRVGLAKTLFLRAIDRRGIGAATDELGRVLASRHALPEAYAAHVEALSIRQELGDERSVAVSLANMARVSFEMGNWAEAQAQMEQALGKRRAIRDLLGIAQSLCDLGTLAEARGDWGQALLALDEAVAIATEIGAASVRADAASRRGEVKLRRGDSEGALRDLTVALALAESLPYPRIRASCARRLAEVRLVRGELELATQCADAAIEHARRLGRQHEIGAALRISGECMVRRNEQVDGLTRLEEAAGLLRGFAQSEVELERCARTLAAAYAGQRRAIESQRWGTLADDLAKQHRRRVSAQ